jgi:hypothetical protein
MSTDQLRINSKPDVPKSDPVGWDLLTMQEVAQIRKISKWTA